MNILFTICGRAGSKGVRGKNARDFLDAPLVWYSMAGIELYIKQFGGGDHFDIVLNTDSDELIKLVEQVKDLKVGVFRRDLSLAGDKVAKVSVIYDCLKRAEIKYGITYDMVVDLDITSPLRTVYDIKNTVERKKERPETNIVYTVTHSRRNPYFNMVKEENGFFVKAIPSNFTTRQEAPVFYDVNASIYAYSASSLRRNEGNKIFESNCDPVVMYDTGVLDIDSEDDYELMQVIAKYLFENKMKYKEIYYKVNNWNNSNINN